jgi:hypothetical protein
MNLIRKILPSIFLVLFGFLAHAQNPMYLMQNGQSRAITPENITGEKAGGARTELEDGSAKKQARFLGKGWKVNPWMNIEPGTEAVLADYSGECVINSIWMTLSTEFYRSAVLEFYWEGEDKPSVQVPVGDFFAQAPVKHPDAQGWVNGFDNYINSAMVIINPYNGLNCYWQMPFRKKFKIVMKNLSDKKIELFYQINFTLQNVPNEAAYFHAQFRRVKKVPFKTPYTLIEGVHGKGHIVGAFILHGAQQKAWLKESEEILDFKQWWGEGEVKFYLDGDDEYPTINCTGEEDYFCGSLCYVKQQPEFGKTYKEYSSLYNGFYRVGDLNLFGQYRWHVTDPIYFEEDFRITVQSLGWYGDGTYVCLEDDYSSVVYWYQEEPYTDFPQYPTLDDLKMNYEDYPSPHN